MKRLLIILIGLLSLSSVFGQLTKKQLRTYDYLYKPKAGKTIEYLNDTLNYRLTSYGGIGYSSYWDFGNLSSEEEAYCITMLEEHYQFDYIRREIPKDSAMFYRIVNYDRWGRPTGKVQMFSMEDSTLLFEGTYADYEYTKSKKSKKKKQGKLDKEDKEELKQERKEEKEKQKSYSAEEKAMLKYTNKRRQRIVLTGEFYMFDFHSENKVIGAFTKPNSKSISYIKAWNKYNELRFKSEFKNGEPEGRLMRWSSGSNLTVDRYYKEGKLDGEIVEYYNNGNVESIAFYRYGKKIGKERLFYENGAPKQDVFRRGGLEESNELLQAANRLLAGFFSKKEPFTYIYNDQDSATLVIYGVEIAKDGQQQFSFKDMCGPDSLSVDVQIIATVKDGAMNGPFIRKENNIEVIKGQYKNNMAVGDWWHRDREALYWSKFFYNDNSYIEGDVTISTQIGRDKDAPAILAVYHTKNNNPHSVEGILFPKDKGIDSSLFRDLTPLGLGEVRLLDSLGGVIMEGKVKITPKLLTMDPKDLENNLPPFEAHVTLEKYGSYDVDFNGKSTKITSFYPNGNPRTVEKYKGLQLRSNSYGKSSIRKAYDKDGNQTYKNGNGYIYSYDDSLKLINKARYRKGYLHGEQLSYYTSTGTLREVAFYYKGSKTDNNFKKYYENGNYKKVLSGDSTILYYESGEVKSIDYYDTYVKYAESGALIHKEVAYNFKKEDESKHTYYNKNKRYLQQWYEDGTKKVILDTNYYIAWHENGNKYREYSETEEKQSYYEWYKNGNMRSYYADTAYYDTIWFDSARIEWNDWVKRYDNSNPYSYYYYDDEEEEIDSITLVTMAKTTPIYKTSKRWKQCGAIEEFYNNAQLRSQVCKRVEKPDTSSSEDNYYSRNDSYYSEHVVDYASYYDNDGPAFVLGDSLGTFYAKNGDSLIYKGAGKLHLTYKEWEGLEIGDVFNDVPSYSSYSYSYSYEKKEVDSTAIEGIDNILSEFAFDLNINTEKERSTDNFWIDMEMVNGQIISWKEYTDDSILIYFEEFDSLGEFNQKQYFTLDGKPIIEYRYETINGSDYKSRKVWNAWDITGVQIIKDGEGYYDNYYELEDSKSSYKKAGRLMGDYLIKNKITDACVIKYKGPYKKGLRHGLWIKYDSKGIKLAELTYEYGELINKVKF